MNFTNNTTTLALKVLTGNDYLAPVRHRVNQFYENADRNLLLLLVHDTEEFSLVGRPATFNMSPKPSPEVSDRVEVQGL
jgi:hypothetical protein